MKGTKYYVKQFFAFFLITVSMVNGAALSNNLLLMLFFWEGLLLTTFVLIFAGSKNSFAAATKALIIQAVADLLMTLGILMIGWQAGTFEMDQINLPMNYWGSFSFILVMIGAIAKAGSMPFHSWIPDAAVSAPLPFMAFLPAALEKLLGIYFLSRITLNLYQFEPGSSMSTLMMSIGAITILLAAMMALIQKDFKKLLSYCAISQVGYMVLGIGTALPIGIVGGIFHMINHAMYKSTLFLIGGSVEKQVGTTNLEVLGGLGRKMPVTFTCFIIAAAAVSGVPPLNGFFSKELIFDGALESGTIFYLATLLGAFLTAASFLKLGHAAFLGKPTTDISNVKEASWPMLIPMIVIAGFCVLFGVYNPLPLQNLIQPVLGAKMEGHDFSGLPHAWNLVIISVIVLLLALANHIYGVKKTKRGLGAVDHIHYAPGLHQMYNWAEKRYFDPYDISRFFVRILSKALYAIDRAIDWFYDTFCVWVATSLSKILKKAYSGNFSASVSWSLIGIVIIIVTTMILM
ncbi:MAG TPA: proton-conducting transporter membrane subunit [Bacteroidales bacterium]|nr:proton-conducting transporter membrane subunit [Bacteroidales bacterium]HPS16855.1 proton-conducting transporter membrane subunit [Bacteroidales bacterium]